MSPEPETHAETVRRYIENSKGSGPNDYGRYDVQHPWQPTKGWPFEPECPEVCRLCAMSRETYDELVELVQIASDEARARFDAERYPHPGRNQR